MHCSKSACACNKYYALSTWAISVWISRTPASFFQEGSAARGNWRWLGGVPRPHKTSFSSSLCGKINIKDFIGFFGLSSMTTVIACCTYAPSEQPLAPNLGHLGRCRTSRACKHRSSGIYGKFRMGCMYHWDHLCDFSLVSFAQFSYSRLPCLTSAIKKYI